MIKVVLEAPRHLALEEAPPPGPPGPGEATVRVLRVGVCGTDLHAYLGDQASLEYPRVLGHELAVEVTALGDGVGSEADRHGRGSSSAHGTATARVHVGDRCTVLPYLSDGTCSACRRGRENCCETLAVLGVHIDGGMCGSLNLPVTHLLPANDLPVDALALVEMLSIGAHAVRRAAIEAQDDVLVIGAGPIGLGAAALARPRVRRLALLDLSPARLAFVTALGIAETIDGRPRAARSGATTAPDGDTDTDPAGDTERAVRDAFGGELPTVVFDATGSSGSMERAAGLVANGGRLVLIGHTRGELRFDNQLLHRRELSLLFSRNATRADFDTVLHALRSGEVDVLPWITTRAGPAALVRDLGSWTDPEHGVVKAILQLA